MKLQFDADFDGDISGYVSEIGLFSGHNKLV